MTDQPFKQSACLDGEVTTLRRGPYEYSLIGEYVRLLLILSALLVLMWLAQLAFRENVSLPSLLAVVVLLATLVTARGMLWLRVFMLAAMTFNVFAVVTNPDDVWSGRDTVDPLVIPSLILLICLTVAFIFEAGSMIRERGRPNWIKLLCLGMLASSVAGYIVGVPLVNAFWESFSGDASNAAARAPGWTISKEMLFRSAKFVVFAIFTYFGACIGSFLNVVAYGIPRGESVGLRNSSCPKCNAKISRIDNLPVFSYLNLSARCRSCQAPIPVRYLLVELQVAAIFGSLFLYELVTGAANVPAMSRISYSGILWIVLYPKWNIIGIYLFHSLFMSFLVVLSLIEWDRQKLKLRFSIALVLLFLLAATAYLPLQPIPAPEYLSSLVGHIPAVSQFAKLVFGGIVGAIAASFFGSVTEQENRSTFFPAMTLAGVVLGWQTTLHVSVLFAVLLLAVRFVPRLRRPLSAQPTLIFLTAVMIHHPIWKTVYEWISI